jgi:hypothetical protein
MKYSKGDRVIVSREVAKWYLSEEAIASYTSPLTQRVTFDYYLDVEAMKKLLRDGQNVATVVRGHHLGTRDENYKVMLNGAEFLIETRYLSKYSSIINYPEAL